MCFTWSAAQPSIPFDGSTMFSCAWPDRFPLVLSRVSHFLVRKFGIDKVRQHVGAGDICGQSNLLGLVGMTMSIVGQHCEKIVESVFF